MNTSQYMDKQIMDLSKSQPTDFLNLTVPPDDYEVDDKEKEEIVPSYDFQPIRPQQNSQGLDDVVGGATGTRVWSSADSVGIRNYTSLDSTGPAKVVRDKDHGASHADLVTEIDRTMKKYADNLMHALDGVSARISQLESRSRNLENSMDDLKVTVGNNQGSTDGKLRQLENILREVQSGVQVIRDKQDILEGQLHLAKLQVSKVEHQEEPQGLTQPESFQQIATAPPQSHHQQMPAPPISLPPPPAPQQTLSPQDSLANQYPPNQNLPPPQRDSYYPPSQPQETTRPYPPPPPLSAPAPQPPYPPALSQYSQPPPPQQHPSLPSMNPPQPQLSLSHHPKDSPYPLPQNYPPNAPNPNSQQFYGPPSHIYEPQSNRPGSGYPPNYGPSSAPNEPPPYPYGGPSSQYGGGGMKQQLSSSQGGGRDYPQLPTARVLPQSLPTASAVGGAPGVGSGGGNRVPIDDVVDKVTSMGFPRDQVRATVRKLTENGQSVDLNIVLDKLMTDGVEAQPQRGWFGR